MTRYEWLNDKENRAEVYNLLRFTLEEIQPDEVPFLDGIYDNYVDLARRGEVDLDDRRRPFNFAGTEDVVSVWLIPLTIEVANSLIIAAGLYSLKKSADLLLHHHAATPTTPKTETVRDCIRKTLTEQPFKIDEQDREYLENALVNVVELVLGA